MTTGKKDCAREHDLANQYEKREYNFDDAEDIKRSCNRQEQVYFEGITGTRKINFPLKNLVEIFMQGISIDGA